MKPATARRNIALMIAATGFAAGAAQSADAPKHAWGKAGVSYDQYRDEAYDCAMFGLSSDIANTEPVEKLRSATRQMEALDARQSVASAGDPVAAGIRHAQDVEAVRSSTRPEQQVKEVKKILFSAMQQCMIQRGYTRFALTEAQRSEMAKFKDGSQERREYLHKLASDAAIVEQQKQPLPAE